MSNKIKNGDSPAFSQNLDWQADMERHLSKPEKYSAPSTEGLGVTKREYFAAMAMQGLIDTFNGEHSKELAKRSIQAADELLKQLDNEQN